MTCVGLILETEERGEKREKRISDAMCTREEQLARLTQHETSTVPFYKQHDGIILKQDAFVIIRKLQSSIYHNRSSS